ncbi:MAG: sigma-54-dependent Fis family transcriptional regulator [Bacteroidetes bacterium GWF2_33_16]|nr:MAG: sigma-54-dependent Fis family transcriptional regulator [Bacteroidetes bacterium GWE2_32_14]OFY03347.1 MAG: sigma-54-dependent Fis family transcriptional regulator [Bacteroidetes bacterium GWF2_33_16]
MSKIKGKILIIDDNEGILKSLSFVLGQEFDEIITIKSPSKFTSLLQSGSFDVILLDMNFTAGTNTGNEGIFWLREIMRSDKNAIVILITAYGDIELAVKTMKEGATDFIQKPFDPIKLISTVKAAFQLRQSKLKVSKLEQTKKVLSEDLNKNFTTLIGKSPALMNVLETVRKVAPTDANVLILGENGTGKELIAREIHRQSHRANEVFISVDLGSISETLFESELFGHRKGAFTDAKEDRIGRFETASGGTLFLDEIGNIPVSLQSKLLTVLQNRLIIPVGSSKQFEIDVRLISATNKSLPNMIKSNLFREDLMFRINTVQIEIPPLRERGDDIILLAEHFIKIYSKKYDKPEIKINTNAIDRLLKYDWPGNVRELQHMMENAVIMADGFTIKPENLQFTTRIANESPIKTKSLNLNDIEKETIKEALLKHKGNIFKTAEELGITRKTLYNKIEKYEL